MVAALSVEVSWELETGSVGRSKTVKKNATNPAMAPSKLATTRFRAPRFLTTIIQMAAQIEKLKMKKKRASMEGVFSEGHWGLAP